MYPLPLCPFPSKVSDDFIPLSSTELERKLKSDVTSFLVRRGQRRLSSQRSHGSPDIILYQKKTSSEEKNVNVDDEVSDDTALLDSVMFGISKQWIERLARAQTKLENRMQRRENEPTTTTLTNEEIHPSNSRQNEEESKNKQSRVPNSSSTAKLKRKKKNSRSKGTSLRKVALGESCTNISTFYYGTACCDTNKNSDGDHNDV
eukprot:g2110.t1